MSSPSSSSALNKTTAQVLKGLPLPKSSTPEAAARFQVLLSELATVEGHLKQRRAGATLVRLEERRVKALYATFKSKLRAATAPAAAAPIAAAAAGSGASNQRI